MSDDSTPSVGKLFASLALFVVLGVPMVAYLWETVHQVLALKIDGMRLLISIPVLILFAGLLALLGRALGGPAAKS